MTLPLKSESLKALPSSASISTLCADRMASASGVGIGRGSRASCLEVVEASIARGGGAVLQEIESAELINRMIVKLRLLIRTGFSIEICSQPFGCFAQWHTVIFR